MLANLPRLPSLRLLLAAAVASSTLLACESRSRSTRRSGGGGSDSEADGSGGDAGADAGIDVAGDAGIDGAGDAPDPDAGAPDLADATRDGTEEVAPGDTGADPPPGDSAADADIAPDTTSDAGGPTAISIYDLRDPSSGHSLPDGSDVVLREVLVSSVDSFAPADEPDKAGHFWVQEETGGPWSGIFVHNRGGTTVDTSGLSVGDTVTVVGRYEEFYGLAQIVVSSFEIDARGGTITPAVVNPADVATGGSAAESWESVLISVRDVAVVNPDAGFGMWTVTGDLVIDDEVYRTSDRPLISDRFDAITGILTFTFDARQLLPRFESDLDRGTPPPPLSIFEVRDPTEPRHPLPGSRITVEDVVVTAVDRFGSLTGDFWVQEIAGGPFSGIQVYNSGAAALDVSTLEPGDAVAVTGMYVEFGATGGDTVSQIRADSVTETGRATLPTPALIAAPASLVSGATAEQWEGVPVRVRDVLATTAEDAYGAFPITGGLTVDDDLFNSPTPITSGLALDEITGILHFSFGIFRLLPRQLADLVPATLLEDCTNGVDDDGDADADCDDPDCAIAPECSGPVVVTIRQIQDDAAAGHPATDSEVEVRGAVVTAVDMRGTGDSSGHFWIGTPAGGLFSGIYVYNPGGNTVDASSLARGDIVTVVGTYQEYYGVSEIRVATVTETGAGAVPAPELVDPARIVTDAAYAEAREGMLCRVLSVAVTEEADMYGQWRITGSLLVDDEMYSGPPALGTSFASVTGTLQYSFDAWKLEPRSAEDLVR